MEPINRLGAILAEKDSLLKILRELRGEIAELNEEIERINDKFRLPRFGSLEGRVYDIETGAPIEGARVEIAGLRAKTGADGYYGIGDIPAGIHTATCKKVGYEEESEDVVIISGGVTVRDWYLRPVAAKRVSISLYIIIESREKEYTFRDKKGRVKRITRRYPSGRFQSTWECDATLDPATDEYTKVDDDDLAAMKSDFIYELETEFEVFYDIGDVTVGAANVIPDQADVGKPPKKLTLERTVDKPVPPGSSPKEDWQTKIAKFLPEAK